jgi:HSP20 family protein
MFLRLSILQRGEPNRQQPKKGVSMATENATQTATQPTSKEEGRSSPGTGLISKSQDAGMARRQRSGLFGIPLTPYEMLRMTPFSLFRIMTDEFDRALQPLLSEEDSSANIAWVPKVEISERDGKYRIAAELPGLSPEEVKVEVEDGALILQGERQAEREATEGGVRRSERQYGYFYRRIPLPEGADPEQVKAKFQDGILEITLPAPQQKTERKQIEIEADHTSSSEKHKQAA